MRMSEETFNFRLHKAWHCLVGWVLVTHWSPRVSIFGVFLSPDILSPRPWPADTESRDKGGAGERTTWSQPVVLLMEHFSAYSIPEHLSVRMHILSLLCNC